MARIKYRQIVQNESREKDVLEGLGIQNKEKLIYKEGNTLTQLFLKKKEVCLKRIDKEKQIFLCFEEGKRKNGFLKIENGTIPLQIDTEKLIQENGFLKIIYEIKNQETKIDKIEFAFYYEVI